MRETELARLENRIYSRSITSLQRHAIYDGEILGFDTEYSSKTRRLLSYQLYWKDKGVFIPASKITPEILVRTAAKMIGTRPARILLVAYFSLAELQFLDVKHGATDRREFARGSMDVSFQTGCTELDITDLFRWFDGQSLANAAKAMGYEKKEWDTKHVTPRMLKDKRFQEYAIHDAKLAHDIYLDLRKQFLQKGVDIVTARTAPSASASVFRMHHVTKKLYCDVNRVRLLACQGTWGGHADVFRRGVLNETHYEYDMDAAYPNAAISLVTMPMQKTWRAVSSTATLRRYIGGFGRFAFSFPKRTRYPSLPVIAKNEAMIYPLQGESSCTFAEVEVALEQGATVRIVEAYGYKGGTRILADYMQELLEQRRNATGALKIFCKLCANSIIGKFAQRAEGFSIQAMHDLAKAAGTNIDEVADMSNAERSELAAAYGIKVDKFSLGPIWLPEWNGLITGHTRARGARALIAIDGVYMHTDSVWSPTPPAVAMKKLGTGWTLKAQGPVTIARTRFAALWDTAKDKEGKSKAHVAHHSVWTRIVAEQMLKKFDGVKDVFRRYPKTRPLHYKEALKTDHQVGYWIGPGDKGYWRTATTAWDGKRMLLSGGDTAPWNTVADYEKYLDTRKANKVRV